MMTGVNILFTSDNDPLQIISSFIPNVFENNHGDSFAHSLEKYFNILNYKKV